jgi:hypothetical protein
MRATIERIGYSDLGKVLAVVICLGSFPTFFGSPSWAEETRVADEGQLRTAIVAAKPGDRIVIRPGLYRLGKVSIRNAGSQSAPITLTAEHPGSVKLETDAVELFKVAAPHWIFEDLDIRGGDQSDHAFHIVGASDQVAIRGNRLVNFHAAIKGNPEGGEVPDFVTIERNIIYNEAPRKTAAPVTPIDVVGGDGWVVRSNFIADFAKSLGNRISFGAFLKGGSTNGLFERNLVYCEWRHSGGRRVGLSFGGGGTGAAYFGNCANGQCPAEHSNGILRNNIVLNCPQADGIYIRNSRDIGIYHNTIYRSYGILLQFPDSTARIQNNIIAGAVALREDARALAVDNLETGMSIGSFIPGGAKRLNHRISDYDAKFPSIFDRADIEGLQAFIHDLSGWLGESPLGRGDADFHEWFVSPENGDLSLFEGEEILGQGRSLAEVPDDFCGHARRGDRVDLGAIDYQSGNCELKSWLHGLIGRFDQE